MSNGLKLDACTTLKHRGNLTESNKPLQNWDEEEPCWGTQKSCAFLMSGGFLTTILVSLTLKDYLNHDLIHDLIAFQFLFLKIHGMKQ